MNIFQELSNSCSQYIRIDTSQSRYNLDSVNGCGSKDCTNLIIFLTDFDSYTLDRPVYYISGEVHGDEVIGPPSVTEFAKYFCDTYSTKKHSLYHNILKNKLIIITPMTNAYGYYNRKRDDKVFIPKSNSFIYPDPNRDFPYYKSNDTIKNCMQTLSARTINEIFNEFIVGGAITFHAGSSVLGYPWGNYLHSYKENNNLKSTEAPDFKAFDNIGKIMVKYSSSKDNKDNRIIDYKLGDMTSTVYPLDGALEDWAYGGWENKELEKLGSNLRPIKTCQPNSFNQYEMIWENQVNDYDYKLRCLIYLAEASNSKRPDIAKYGYNNFDMNNNGDIFDFYKTTNFYGHVPRNMRLMYSGIDLIYSSIYLDIEHIQETKDKTIIPFLFMGCLSLQEYSIYKVPFEHISKNNLNKNFMYLNCNETTLLSKVDKNISCYFNNLTYYNLVIERQKSMKKNNLRNIEEKINSDPMHHFVRPGGNYDYLGNVLGIRLKNKTYVKEPKRGSIYFVRGEGPDQNWGSQNNPDPGVEPQSHVVRSKIKSDYYVKNGNYSLKSNYFFYSYPVVAFDDEEIQIVDDEDSFFYQRDFNFIELIININDINYKVVSGIIIHKQKKYDNTENINHYLSSETVFQINLLIHISEEKGNYMKELLKEKKDIKLNSQILLSDEKENYHLNKLECNYFGDLSIYIRCNDILKNAKGRDIRAKLLNSIVSFELKYENTTFLNIFGQFTLKSDYKGKYYIDYYSEKNSTENNRMLCSSNFPYFLNIFNHTPNEYNIDDDIYYVLNISKVSTNLLKIDIDIKQNNGNKYNYFLIFFPYSNKIELFDIKRNIFEVEIILDENANGKIIGKTVYIIPIKDEDYESVFFIDFKTNDVMSLISSINKLFKNLDYKLMPCSIVSYNSFREENSIRELKKMIEESKEIKVIRRKKDKFIFKHFFISIIILSFLLIVIFCALIRYYRKKSRMKQFDEVIIADPGYTHSNRNIKC